MKDYYKILEVDRDCETEEIKKSYKKLALKYHPDKNNGDDTKFKEISEAYEVLSDNNRRSQYDYNFSHDINFSTFGHQFMKPDDLFKQIFQNSDLDILASFMNDDNISSNSFTKSVSSSVTIQNGKKIVKTTTVENGITTTEEKIYDFITNDFLKNNK
jgi:DnaJ-class molecular chaperone